MSFTLLLTQWHVVHICVGFLVCCLGKSWSLAWRVTSSLLFPLLLLRCPLTRRVDVRPCFILICCISLCHAVQFAVCSVCTQLCCLIPPILSLLSTPFSMHPMSAWSQASAAPIGVEPCSSFRNAFDTSCDYSTWWCALCAIFGCLYYTAHTYNASCLLRISGGIELALSHILMSFLWALHLLSVLGAVSECHTGWKYSGG